MVITTRAEDDIIRQLKGDAFLTMRMSDIDPNSAVQDIGIYIRHRLLLDPAERDDILEGIDEDCCHQLTDNSQGLFQWAYVACETIRVN